MEGGKPEDPGEKPFIEQAKNQHKLNPFIILGPGVKPGPHWWEVSTFTTVPSLLPVIEKRAVASLQAKALASVILLFLLFYFLEVEG